MMSDHPFDRVQELFLAACELEPEEQLAFLDRECAEDQGLRAELVALLGHDQPAHDPLEKGDPLLRELMPNNTPDEKATDASETEEPTDLSGTTIGPFKLLQRLGEGGMGTVYMADRSHPIKQRVALKIIKPGLDTRQVIARFEAERQALALMDHNNIARVLDAGTTGLGRPYFAMELVKGSPITTYCDKHQLDLHERLRLFIPVCHAIQHAHQKGIIHRDIKPSNVMVCRYDGQPVPKVIDFGVAKATHQTLTQRTLFTAIGQVVGTFEYMSPEQAEMNQLDIDTRSDIYSLGVVLYELLTGSTPITTQQLRAVGISEILRTIRESEPPKPSTRISDSKSDLIDLSALRKTEPSKLPKILRGDLDWIVMKTLEKERWRRYETASGLAADIERYLAGEPVEAGPPSATYRLKKSALKHKSLLATVLAVFLLLALSLAVTVPALFFAREALNEASQQRDAAKTAKAEAERSEAEATNSETVARKLLYRSDMREAMLAKSTGDIGRIRELTLRHLPEPDQVDHRDFVWHHLWDAIHPYDQVLPHGDPIIDVAVSDDGTTLATISNDGLCKIWDLNSGRQILRRSVEVRDRARVALSPDGSRFAVAGDGAYRLVIRSTQNGETLSTIESFSKYLASVCWFPDGKTIGTVCHYKMELSLHDESTGDRIAHWDALLENVRRVVPSPDGRKIAISNVNSGTISQVAIVDRSSSAISRLSRHSGVSAKTQDVDLAFSPDSTVLASCGGQDIHFWNVESATLQKHLRTSNESWRAIAFHPHDPVCFACGSRSITRIDLNDFTTKKLNVGHAGDLTGLAITNDGKSLITVATDGIALVSQIGQLVPQDHRFDSEVLALNLPSSDHADVICSDGNLYRVDLDSGGQSTSMQLGSDLTNAAFSDDSTALAYSLGNQEVWLTRIGSRETPARIIAETSGWRTGIQELLFSSSSRRLVIPQRGYRTLVFDTERERLGMVFDSWQAKTAAISSDDTMVALTVGGNGSSGRRLEIRSLASGRLSRFVNSTAGEIECCTFSRSADLIASGDSEGVIRIAATQGEASEKTLRGHGSRIASLVFLAEDQILSSVSSDGEIRWWSIDDGELIAALRTGIDRPVQLAFSPDGQVGCLAGKTQIRTFRSPRYDSTDRFLAIDIALSNASWESLFRNFVLDGKNEHLLDLLEFATRRVNQSVAAEDDTRALVELDKLDALLDQIKQQRSILESNRTAYDYVSLLSLLTRSTLATRAGDVRASNQLMKQADSLRTTTETALMHSSNLYALQAFAEFRAEGTRNAPPNQRKRRFLTDLLDGYYWFYVTVLDSSGKLKRVWRSSQLPEGDFQITAMGETNPFHCLWLTKEDYKQLSDEPLFKTLHLNLSSSSDSLWENLPALQQIATLGLWNWTGTNQEQVKVLSQLPKLKELFLDREFTGFQELRSIAESSSVETIRFKDTVIRESDALVLQYFPNLKQLDFANCSLSDKSIAEISKVTALQRVKFSETPVLDTSLRHFAEHRNLQVIQIDNCRLSALAFDALTRIKPLRIVEFLNENVNAKQIGAFRKARPNCTVGHRLGYIEKTSRYAASFDIEGLEFSSKFFPTASQVAEFLEELGSAISNSDNADSLSDTLELVSEICLSEEDPQLTEVALKQLAENEQAVIKIDWQTLGRMRSDGTKFSLPEQIANAGASESDFESAIWFEGLDARARLPVETIDLRKGLTVEAWVCPLKLSGVSDWGDECMYLRQAIPGKTSEFNVRFSDSGKWLFQYACRSREKMGWVNGGPASRDHMTHLAAVIIENEIQLFVDGKKTGQDNIELSDTVYPVEIILGGSRSSRFQGIMDEVRVSTTARYQEDFAPQRRLQSDDETWAHFHFEQNPYRICHDSSGRGMHVWSGARFIRLEETNAPPRNAGDDDPGTVRLKENVTTTLTPGFLTERNRSKRENWQTALNLGGDSAPISLPAFESDPADGLTVEGWVRQSKFSGRTPWGDEVFAISNGDDKQFFTNYRITHNLRWFAQFSDIKGGEELHATAPFESSTDLVHVAAVVTNTNASLFVSGNEVASVELPNEPLSQHWQIMIGGRHFGEAVFHGIVDEVRVSRTARYSEPFVPEREFTADGDTHALYHFDANPAGLLYDHSASFNHIPCDYDFVAVIDEEDPFTIEPFESAADGTELGDYYHRLPRVDPATLPKLQAIGD